jgi:Leucine-rich repeat (LRR) protein
MPEYVVALGDKARVVDVSSNALRELPDGVGAMRRAHKFNAARNALTRLPDALCAMAALKTLRLEGNRIEALPEAIGELAKLEELALADNRVRRLPASVGKLKRLTLLDASRNRLGADDRAGMSDADVDADADACGGLTHLAGCVNLAALKVDGNARVTRLPPILGALTKLATVSCDGTGVRAVPPEILAGCASLKALSLRGCPIDVEALKETDGYDAFEVRRKAGRDKQIRGGVMLDSGGFEDGLRS